MPGTPVLAPSDHREWETPERGSKRAGTPHHIHVVFHALIMAGQGWALCFFFFPLLNQKAPPH